MLGGLRLGVTIMAACTWLAQPAESAEPERAAAKNDQPVRQADERYVFKTTPQGDLKLHVYHPAAWKATDHRPAIVFWFGGGFAKGTVAAFGRQSTYFASRGLVCICAEYRVKLIHGTEIDKCVEDARSAMRWVKSHASQLGVDPDKIIASGGSAGGTLALLVTLGEGPDAKEDDLKVSTSPCALVLFNPAQGEAIANIARRIEASDDEKARRIKLLAAIDEPQKAEPPAIFFFGTDDQLLAASRSFCQKSNELGNRCELWTAEAQKHTFFNRSPWYEATLRKADEFLVSLGYLQGSPTIAANPEAVLKAETTP
jgi:acetyl esterase